MGRCGGGIESGVLINDTKIDGVDGESVLKL
jgi:hypothetical protein